MPRPRHEALVADDFRSWSELMSDRFVPLELSRPSSREPFRGQVTSRDFDGIHVSRVRSSAHLVRRLPAQIHDGQERFLKLTLQLEGVSSYTQDGRAAEIGPGDLVVYDTARPYTIWHGEGVESLIVMLRPTELTLALKGLRDLTAVRIAPNSVVGECAEPFLRRFAERFERVSRADGVRMLRPFLGLVDAMLHAELSRHAWVDDDFGQICAYIRTHLRDDDLGPGRIAADNFLSVRTLHYLFHEHGETVSAWIRRERLENCRLDLEDPALAGLPVWQVAAGWGFATAASFSRQFRQAFGLSPAAWRAAALAARTAPAAVEPALVD